MKKRLKWTRTKVKAKKFVCALLTLVLKRYKKLSLYTDLNQKLLQHSLNIIIILVAEYKYITMIFSLIVCFMEKFYKNL